MKEKFPNWIKLNWKVNEKKQVLEVKNNKTLQKIFIIKILL